jgi:type I restriction enzyme S subunit
MFAKSITSSGNSSNKIESPHLERQLVAVPSLDEQRKIGALLKGLDNLIAANHLSRTTEKDLLTLQLSIRRPNRI